MLDFIQSQILFYLSIAVVMFLPGWFLLLAVFGRSEKNISVLERFIFSLSLGIIVANFIAFAYSRFNLPVTAFSSIAGTLVFCVVCFGIYKKLHQNQAKKEKNDVRVAAENFVKNKNSLFNFSKNQLTLIFLFLFLTVFIKVAYLSGTVAPTATDMGHHMYWTKLIAETHQLPDYEGMPDFIVGEHVVLAEIAMIGGLSVFSAFPVVFLLFVNILGILTVFLLTIRIFQSKNVAILTLLFLGILFAVSSPQAKFISGGVLGNILGNMLMPLTFYFYFRAVEILTGEALEKIETDDHPAIAESGKFLSLGIFSTFGLFYTHHLTAFIFLFVWALLTLLFFALNYKKIKNIAVIVIRVIFSRSVIATLAVCLIFFFFVFTPNYMKKDAVERAVGTPSKSTREGLSLTNLKNSVGEVRIALGFFGLLALAAAYKRRNFGFAIIASWAIMLFVMSVWPRILLVDLPSSRIGNYLGYPLAILSAFGLYSVFNSKTFSSIPEKFLKSALMVILIFIFTSGLKDSADAFKKAPDFVPTLETFAASRYLANNTNSDEMLLKDHNYLAGDTWMKLFFMRGYTYPLSRSYFRRYEDPTNLRETCTLSMISIPAGAEAEACYAKTATKYIMVNPRYDSSQFAKLKNFNSVYNSGGVAVYYRK